MRSSKNYLLLFFVFTTIAGVIIAWRQHLELIELRAAALAREMASAPPATSSPSASETPTAPEAEALPVAEATADAAQMEQSVAAGPRPAPAERRGFSRAALMDNPEIQRLMMMQRKASLDNRYAALFKSLNLPPDQLERFKELLVERLNVRSDVMSAARSQGLNFREDREAIDALVAQSEAEMDNNLRAALGESVYSQWKDYERTLPQRNTVDRLEQRLSYTSTPLSQEQAAAMLQILDRSGASANPRRGAMVNDTAVEQARGVLAAPQLDALRQLQEEQQVQAEINAAMRRQFERNRGDSSAGGASGSRPGG